VSRVRFVISENWENLNVESVDHGRHCVNDEIAVSVRSRCPSSVINNVSSKNDVGDIL